MLRHRNILLLLIISLAALILLNRTYAIHWSLYLLLFILFFSAEFYGAYFIHANFHLKAICGINTNEKVIALTFDDGPVALTEKVLEVLNEFDAKATFFCIGNRIGGKEDILRKADAQGHLIGNHSYSHSFMFDLKTKSQFVDDLQSCDGEIKKAIGKSPAFFRPPYGVTTPALAKAVKKLKYEVIGWNIRSLDTAIKDRSQLLSRIKTRIKPGAVLLLHDTTAGIEIVLKEVLLYLKENNYRVVPLDTLIQKKAYV